MQSLTAIVFMAATLVPSADVTTLAGKKHSGELTAISPQGVTLKTVDGNVEIPSADLLHIDLTTENTNRLPYTEVELADGSILICGSVALKEKDAILTLKSGPAVTCPLTAVATVLNIAQDAAARQEWRQLLRKRGLFDMLIVRNEGKLDALDGTFGPGNATGDAIEFAVGGGEQKITAKLSRVQGLVFVRKPAVDAPAVFCKVTDVGGNQFIAKAVRLDKSAVEIDLVGGGSVKYLALDKLHRLDFSKGKLAYLSDLEPLEVDQSSTDDLVFPYRKDKNLYNGQIRLKSVPYPKGLAIHARTALTYDIGLEYKEFRCVLGVDDVVRAENRTQVHVNVLIEADGRELLRTEVRSRDEPRAIALDVKNVRRLKITVSSPLLDLGNQVDLADARVTK